MHIRKAAITDMDDLMRIEVESFQDERFSRNLLELFVKEDEFETLVCEIDGTVVGYAAAYTEPGVKTRVLSLAVDKEHRRSGIGRSLMQDIELHAQALGSIKVTLEVRMNNVTAVNLYLRGGYLIRGIIPDYYGKGKDALYMEKKLEGGNAHRNLDNPVS
jgi:[ribosomal protein S18]-alanine N-acetyltransferase